MKNYILVNSFSLNMVKEIIVGKKQKGLYSSFLRVIMVTENEFKNKVVDSYLSCIKEPKSYSFINAIGHPDTDCLIRSILNLPFEDFPEGKRVSISVKENDVILVAQYNGPRLPEGCKTLPDGAVFDYYVIYLQ